MTDDLEAPPKEETTKCPECQHTRDQHDEDGFCEKEDGVLGFCKCPGWPAGEETVEPDAPPEGTGPGENAE